MRKWWKRRESFKNGENTPRRIEKRKWVDSNGLVRPLNVVMKSTHQWIIASKSHNKRVQKVPRLSWETLLWNIQCRTKEKSLLEMRHSWVAKRVEHLIKSFLSLLEDRGLCRARTSHNWRPKLHLILQLTNRLWKIWGNLFRVQSFRKWRLSDCKTTYSSNKDHRPTTIYNSDPLN